MAAASMRAAAMLWLVVAIIAAALAPETSGAEAAEQQQQQQQLGCFCDCMKNRCMTLGAGADKLDCAAACTGGCAQIGQPGQPRADDFCGF